MHSQARLVRAIVLAGVSQLAIANAGFAASTSDAVIRWSANAGVASTKACIAKVDEPFHESRIYAMMHIAIHDSLNAIDHRYQPYAFDKKADPGASPDAAVAAAAHDVLVKLIGQLPAELFKKDCIADGIASTEAAYTVALADIPDGPAKTQGIALGKEAAAAILAKRVNDHADAGPWLNMNCPPPGPPGTFQCTPGLPAKFVVFEAWANVEPFVLKDNTQFRPGPPYAVTDAKFKADLDEVKALGGDGKTTPSTRTEDQTQIALFWLESSPLKWSRIARTVATAKEQNMWQNARLLAILDMALADGYVAMAASKNHYGFWRPVTAIQNGGDGSWTPLRVTPPGPGLSVGSCDGRWDRGRGVEADVRHRPDQLPGLWYDVASWNHML